MATGPGKYDDVCTTVRETTKALAAVVIVLNGDKGSGFSVQSTQRVEKEKLAKMLEILAEELRGETAPAVKELTQEEFEAARKENAEAGFPDLGPCCRKEDRNINGGCKNCGDHCY